MAFQNLAVELILMIVDAIGHDHAGIQARVRLTAACKHLREMLLPLAFEVVRFSNDRRISDSALLAAQNHGIHIKKLHFVGFDPVLAISGAPREAVENRNYTLPDSALTLFEAKRTLLPRLQTFIVEFGHNFDDYPERWTDRGYGMGFFDYNPHAQDTPVLWDSPEDSLIELWEHTYSALASNSTVSHLIISNWTPTICKAHLREKWWAYLARLEKFELTIADYIGVEKHRARDRSLLISSNAVCGVPIVKMDQFFFDHLSGARTIKFSGSKRLWVGSLLLQPRPRVTLPCGTGVLESLVSLELSRIFISAELVRFIRRHRDTLRTLILKDVLALAASPRSSDEAAHITLPWSDFFLILYKTQGLALTNFQVTSICPLQEKEAKAQIKRDVFGDPDTVDHNIANKFSHDSQGSQEVLAAFRIRWALDLAENKHRKLRLFGYGELDRKTGFPRLHASLNRRRFEEGQDQAAYEKFMDQLESSGRGAR